jgi:hypothetical protein
VKVVLKSRADGAGMAIFANGSKTQMKYNPVASSDNMRQENIVKIRFLQDMSE